MGVATGVTYIRDSKFKIQIIIMEKREGKEEKKGGGGIPTLDYHPIKRLKQATLVIIPPPLIPPLFF